MMRPRSAETERVSPSMRAKQDAEKRAARLARKMERASPGPGTYETRLPESAGLSYAGSTAFKGSFRDLTLASARSKGVGPGLYDPHENATVAARSARTANKAASVGQGSFGSTARREGNMKIDWQTGDVEIPGPTAYDPKELEPPSSARGTSSFASGTRRGAHVRREQTPGAGDYGDVSRSILDRSILGGQSSFRGQAARDTGLIGAAAKDMTYVGPGSYSPEGHTMNSARRARTTNQSTRGTSTFASTASRECRIVMTADEMLQA